MSSDHALQESFEAALAKLEAAVAGFLRPKMAEAHSCAAKCLADKALGDVAALEGSVQCMAKMAEAEEKPARIMQTFQDGIHRCRAKAGEEFAKKFSGKDSVDRSEQEAFMEAVFAPCVKKELDNVPSLIKQLK